jgi:gas vesicle protein
MTEIENLEDYESRAEGYVDEREGGRAFMYLLAGIGIGAGLTLLLTPKRGDEVREAIGRGYRKSLEAAQNLRDRAQDLRDRAQDFGEELRERSSNLLRFRRRR